MGAEVRESEFPRPPGSVRVVYLGASVVEEGVGGSRKDLDSDCLPEPLELSLELVSRSGRHRRIVLGEEREQRRLEPCHVGLDGRVDAVEIYARADVGRIGGGGVEGELSAHAEADRAHRLRTRLRILEQITDGSLEQLRRALNV